MEVLTLTKEEVYGEFDTTTPVQEHIFLPAGNAFTVRVVPTFWTISDASMGNRPIRSNVARKPINGALQTLAFPSQIGFLMDLAATLIGTAPCFDLGSFTADYAIYAANCTPIYRRYLGNKFAAFTLTADQSDQGCLLGVNAQIVGSTAAEITATDMPDVGLSAYPEDDPYLFFDTVGGLKINGVRSNYQSLTLTITNTTKQFMDEHQYAQKVQWWGRKVTLAVKLLLKDNSDRLLYEDGTKVAVELKFTKGGASLLINMQGKVVIDSAADDIPIDDFATQTLTLSSLMDPATSTDLSFTVVEEPAGP